MTNNVNILNNLSINQNLVFAIASFAGAYFTCELGGNENVAHITFLTLHVPCCIVFLFAMASLASSLIAYSIEYYRKKIYKGKEYKLDYKNKHIKYDNTIKDCMPIKSNHHIDINITGQIH